MAKSACSRMGILLPSSCREFYSRDKLSMAKIPRQYHFCRCHRQCHFIVLPPGYCYPNHLLQAIDQINDRRLCWCPEFCPSNHPPTSGPGSVWPCPFHHHLSWKHPTQRIYKQSTGSGSTGENRHQLGQFELPVGAIGGWGSNMECHWRGYRKELSVGNFNRDNLVQKKSVCWAELKNMWGF